MFTDYLNILKSIYVDFSLMDNTMFTNRSRVNSSKCWNGLVSCVTCTPQSSPPAISIFVLALGICLPVLSRMQRVEHATGLVWIRPACLRCSPRSHWRTSRSMAGCGSRMTSQSIEACLLGSTSCEASACVPRGSSCVSCGGVMNAIFWLWGIRWHYIKPRKDSKLH